MILSTTVYNTLLVVKSHMFCMVINNTVYKIYVEDYKVMYLPLKYSGVKVCCTSI